MDIQLAMVMKASNGIRYTGVKALAILFCRR